MGEELYAEIACVECDERGCERCGGTGYWRLTECPKKFIGGDIARTANIVTLCDKGHLPVSGGLLDQTNWFISFWQFLTSEINAIESERLERIHAGQ